MKSEISSAPFPNEYTFSGQVFFYCCDGVYQPLSVCLAEGFKELGIPFYSNINYWRTSPDREEYLFCHDPRVIHEDCSIVILEKSWFFQSPSFPKNLFHPERAYITVYLDDSDGPTLWNPEFRNFDFIFRTHYNRKSQYPSNCNPWVFGLSNRVLRETNNLLNFQDRARSLLANFRVDQDQLELSNCWLKVDQGLLRIAQGLLRVDYPLRQIARHQFFPLLQDILSIDDRIDNFEDYPSDSYHYLQWVQTNSRHYPNYYKRLKEVAGCACFGGCIVPIPATGETIVEWWDSWRFWESLAAGCVAFHVDFEKYGIQLPVMPKNWQHYIGIDLDNIQNTVDRITEDREILEKISIEGRRWAIENYSPLPTALRFLQTITSSALWLEKQGHSLTASLPIQMREINLILFPDWSGPEEEISLNFERLLSAVMRHPDRTYMALLIDTSHISEEEASLILSSVTMNLLMQEDLDITEGPEISLVGKLSHTQWEALRPHLHARLVWQNENQQAIAQAQLENISAYELSQFNHQRVVQLETGDWDLR